MHTLKKVPTYKFLSTLLIISPILFLISCGQFTALKNSVEKEFDITGFNQIEVGVTYDIEIIQSEEYKVVIRCDEKIVSKLDVRKEGKTLRLGLLNGKHKNAYLSAKIYMPDLQKIEASGASKITIPTFQTDELEIVSSGAVSIAGNLRINQNLTINGSGASNIDLKGTTQNATIELSGANDFNGKEFMVEHKLTANITGASSATLTANGNIFVDLSGASKLNYYGNGIVVEKNVTGASKLNKR